jgi:hypothetical protein
MRIILAALAVLLLTGCGPTGLDDPETLASTIKTQTNMQIAQTGKVGSVISVVCTESDTAHQFSCWALGSDNSTREFVVLVANGTWTVRS